MLTIPVLSDLPMDLIDEGLHRLAGWPDQEGYADPAETTRLKRGDIPKPEVSMSPFSSWGWGFGGDYHTYRGSMMGGFFNRVEAHFLQGEGSDE